MKHALAACALMACLAATAAGVDDAQFASWRAQIRSNFFLAAPLPALAAETHRQFQPAPGVRAEAVTYESQYGMRVPAILYLPDPRPKGGKIPAFVVVNGHGGDKFSWYAYYTGVTFARAGAAVLTFDPLGEGERNRARKSGTRAHDAVKGDEPLARRMAGTLIGDVMQAVSYIESRPEVDPRRIGAGGYSLGSFVLALTGAVETRLRACVLVGGGNLDGPEGYWDRSKPMCQGLPYRSLNFLGDRPAVIYALHAARGPTLLFNGLEDTVVNMQNTPEPFFNGLRERAARVLGHERGLFETDFAPGVSHRPFWLTRPVVLWLEKNLDFPNWTAAGIEAMPLQRIGDWAATHAVAMDELYATEQREGGTPALDTGVPGFRRDDLSVFSAQHWEARKDRFVIEKWLEAARAAR